MWVKLEQENIIGRDEMWLNLNTVHKIWYTETPVTASLTAITVSGAVIQLAEGETARKWYRQITENLKGGEQICG